MAACMHLRGRLNGDRWLLACCLAAAGLLLEYRWVAECYLTAARWLFECCSTTAWELPGLLGNCFRTARERLENCLGAGKHRNTPRGLLGNSVGTAWGLPGECFGGPLGR
eukprot:130957-Lingulodinium_polyedra.AAC.1